MRKFESTRSIAPKPRKFPPEVLSDDEVRALIEACGRYAWTAVRHRALLTLLYRTGLRLSEALALRPKDLDLRRGTVRVLFGKGGSNRTVGIDPGANRELERWLAARAEVKLPVNAPLFCSVSGRPLTTAFIRRLMPSLGKRAGIQRRVHAHGLRHTHAAQLRTEGVDVAVISRQLGHANLLTTIRYLDHLAPEAVVQAITARKWSSE